MKFSELFPYTFKALRHELGHDRPRDSRPMWQQRLGTASAFCRAVVSNGYLTEAQMQHAAQRYRLGVMYYMLMYNLDSILGPVLYSFNHYSFKRL